MFDQDNLPAGRTEDFTLKHRARIIERDSKDSTYKFALLRGTIDIIQKYPHFVEAVGTRVRYPMGLLLLKWIEYYYPLLAHHTFIPQKYGNDGSDPSACLPISTMSSRWSVPLSPVRIPSSSNGRNLPRASPGTVLFVSRYKVQLQTVKELEEFINRDVKMLEAN